MSDETEREVSHHLERVGKLLPWVRVLVLGAFAMGAWAATLEWRVQNHDAISRKVDEEIRKLSRDASSAYGLRDGHALDTRIARLEVQGDAIRESLLRIEKTLNTR